MRVPCAKLLIVDFWLSIETQTRPGSDFQSTIKNQKSTMVSVAYRLSTAPAIAGAQPFAGLRVNLNALGVAPIRGKELAVVQSDFNVVSHLAQRRDCVRRKQFFTPHTVGQPLIVKA